MILEKLGAHIKKYICKFFNFCIFGQNMLLGVFANSWSLNHLCFSTVQSLWTLHCIFFLKMKESCASYTSVTFILSPLKTHTFRYFQISQATRMMRELRPFSNFLGNQLDMTPAAGHHPFVVGLWWDGNQTQSLENCEPYLPHENVTSICWIACSARVWC
jgi:hypothetical protein